MPPPTEGTPSQVRAGSRSDAAFDRLRQARALDKGSIWARLAADPVRMLTSKALQPLRGSDRVSFRVRVPMFWGEKMTVLMPEGWIYLRFSRYEEELTEFLIGHLGEGGTFVDVGAHFGYFSLLSAYLVGRSGHVHAFEPTPRTFEILSANLGGRPNVVLNQRAAFSSTGSLTMFDMGPGFAGYNSFVAPRLEGDARDKVQARVLENVETVALDEYTAGWPIRPTFVKIDAESAESEVLKGMTSTIRRLRPTLAVEVGDFDLAGVPRSREVIQQILDEGYSAYSLKSGRLVPHVLQADYAPGTIVALPRGWSGGRPHDIVHSTDKDS